MTGDYRNPVTLGPKPGANDVSRLEQRLAESLRLLEAGPTAETLAELERDARDLAAVLNRNTLAHLRANRIAGRLRLLRLALEHA